MAETKTEREPLDDHAAARLAEFARGCKAAARAVSLYPDGHPSVQSSLQRIVEVGRRATLDSIAALATAGATREIMRGSNGVGRM